MDDYDPREPDVAEEAPMPDERAQEADDEATARALERGAYGGDFDHYDPPPREEDWR